MPWRCPACQTPIRHDEDAPRPRTVYRCHVCRLELILDESTHKLTVAPFPGERDQTPSSGRSGRS
jgi:hypothetical protein